MSVSQAVAIAANSALVRAALVEDDLREDGRTTRESRSVVVKCFHAKGNASDLGPETSQVTTCDVRLGQTRACATMSATFAYWSTSDQIVGSSCSARATTVVRHPYSACFFRASFHDGAM